MFKVLLFFRTQFLDLFYQTISKKHIGKANKMEVKLQVTSEILKITLHKWYNGFRHLRTKQEHKF